MMQKRLALLIIMLAAACIPMNTVEPKSAQRSALVDGAESASVMLGSAVSNIHLTPATGETLINADVEYIGELKFDVAGTTARTIELIDDITTYSYSGRELNWNVELNQAVPLTLEVMSSSGDVDLDLTEFTLMGLRINGSSGSVTMDLPAQETTYAVDVIASSGSLAAVLEDGAQVDFPSLNMSSGDTTITTGSSSTVSANVNSSSGTITINLGDGTRFNGELHSSSGNIVLDVPDGAAVRLEIESLSSGTVTVPVDYQHPTGDEKTGVWQTEGYEDADVQIDILVTSVSSGNVDVR